MTNSEPALIRECLAGRIDAFGELIRPYQDRLFNALTRFLGNRDDAAELMQESLLRAYKGLASYQSNASFYTWLFRVAMNTALSARRRARPKVASTQHLAATTGFDPADDTPQNNPAQGLEAADRRRLVESALAEVAEPHRAVLILKDIEGLRYEQIAEILDIPLGTVRSRLHRARHELRARLEPMLAEGLL